MLSAKPKAEADNIDRGLNNSGILRKPNSIIVLLFILWQKENKTSNNWKQKIFIELIIAQLKISSQFVFSHEIPLKYLGRRPITSADYCFRWK
jgi:hypothetical protein